MSKLVLELKENRAKAVVSAKALLDKCDTEKRNLTADEQKSYDGLIAQIDDLKLQIERREKIEALEAETKISEGRKSESNKAEDRGYEVGSNPRVVKPHRGASLRCFNSKDGDQNAYLFGRFIQACAGHEPSKRYCVDKGVAFDYLEDSESRAHASGVNSTGGFLVPEQVDADMIRLVLQYGVFRRNARNFPMTSDQAWRPRRSSGLTAYWSTEGIATTESTMSFDRVNLVTKELTALASFSNELAEDAVVAMSDILAEDMALQFANKEDLAGFLGDQTSTYGGILGLNTSLKSINGTAGTGAGVYLSAATAFSSVVLADFNNTIGKLPTFGRTPNTRWYMSPLFWDSVAVRLAVAAGGVTSGEIVNGVPQLRLLGYPVELTEVFPTS